MNGSRPWRERLLEFEKNSTLKPEYNMTGQQEYEMLRKHYNNIFNQFAVDKKESK
jgi:hypothetical protein|tara:strand:- start:75 stop:239 length:165 start_codon:yes stop_codon:yes gene_type:complete